MGDLYRRCEQYLPPARTDSIMVEIGTARGAGGSTHWFTDLAYRRGQRFHTIDIESRDDILQFISGPITGHWIKGSDWARHHLPLLGQDICLLYLDNFDWDYSVNHYQSHIEYQKQDYLCHGTAMTNQSSVREHLDQMRWCLPYMAPGAVVVCDDTYQYNHCWIGKCAAVVPYLEIHGWTIVDCEEVPGQSYGVILQAPA